MMKFYLSLHNVYELWNLFSREFPYELFLVLSVAEGKYNWDSKMPEII